MTALLLAGCQAEDDSATPTPAPSRDSAFVARPNLDTSFAGDTNSDESTGARRTLQAYYDAIADREYMRAYYLWADSGRASNQTLQSFRDGFKTTGSTEVRIGNGRLEGAAGSQYAEFPVVVEATTGQGTPQRFEGTYVLRRSVVDGASAAQRQWHIYSARIQQVR
jgi:hypothetical protein